MRHKTSIALVVTTILALNHYLCHAIRGTDVATLRLTVTLLSLTVPDIGRARVSKLGIINFFRALDRIFESLLALATPVCLLG